MSDYTYSLPFSNEKFMKGIIMMLKKENKYDLANLGNCETRQARSQF